MKNYLLTVLFLIGMIAVMPFQLFSQQNTTAIKQSLFDLSNGTIYKFTATNVYPLRGRARNLTSDYVIIFSKDTLNGRLPYFGVATSVSYGSTDGGVNLGTNNFTYTQSKDQKSISSITYKLKGSNDVTNIIFRIYKDGTADVSFRFLQREGISYRGTVKKIALP
jgi:hypothetical protein